MRRDLPSGTVTFLFTDVEGSTKLLHELGPERYSHARGVRHKAMTAVSERLDKATLAEAWQTGRALTSEGVASLDLDSLIDHD